MLWHLRPVSPREEHQFFNLVDLYRWFRDWSRALPELAISDLVELDQLLEAPGAELGSFIRAEDAPVALTRLRDRVLKVGIATLGLCADQRCGTEQLLVASFLSGESAFLRRFKKSGPGAREGAISALLDDSILRLDHRSSALLVRRETREGCEVELKHWAAVLRAEPAFEPLLAQWIGGYLAKFRPCRTTLAWRGTELRLEIAEIR